jgi:MHS family proline/betaine transporter-like MFS transporter
MALNDESSDVAVPPVKSRRAIWAAATGTIVENYDNFLYGVVVVAISASLFPPGENAPLGALATFALTFLARPIGAIIFGRIADRRGRKAALVSSLISMAIGTVLVGAVPTYASVGTLAPTILVVLRLFQGLSMGGELGSASIFVAEFVERRRRGLFSSLVYMAAQFGNVLAIIVVLVLQSVMAPDAFVSWGWRLAFLIALLPAGVIVYLRLKTEETPVFKAVEATEATQHTSLGRTLGQNWRPILQIAGLTALGSPFLLVATYLPIFFKKAGLTSIGSTVALLLISIALAVLVPPAGLLGDRIGRKPLLLISGAAMAILVIPAFAIAGAGSVLTGVIGGILIIIPIAVFFGSYPAALSELFSTESRGTGANIGYAVGSSIFATLPLIVAALSASTGNPLVPAYCVFVTSVIGLLAALSLPKARLTAEHHLVEPELVAEELAAEAAAEAGTPATASGDLVEEKRS